MMKWANRSVKVTQFVTEQVNIPSTIELPPWKTRQRTARVNAPFRSETISKVTSAAELANLRSAAKAAAEALRHALELSKTAKNGHELDMKLTQYILDNGSYPSGIGYYGFPKSICISPNDVLVHGIPNKTPFRNGDWMNLDVTVFKNGFFGDNSCMATIGEVDPEITKLVN